MPLKIESSVNYTDPCEALIRQQTMELIEKLPRTKDKRKLLAALKALGIDLTEIMVQPVLELSNQIALRMEIESSCDELRCRVDRRKSKVVITKGDKK